MTVFSVLCVTNPQGFDETIGYIDVSLGIHAIQALETGR